MRVGHAREPALAAALAGLALLALPPPAAAHQPPTPDYHERLITCLDEKPGRSAAELFLACVGRTEFCVEAAEHSVLCRGPGQSHELANWLLVIERLSPSVRALAKEAGRADAFDEAQNAAHRLGHMECSHFRHDVFGEYKEALCHRDWTARRAIELFPAAQESPQMAMTAPAATQAGPLHRMHRATARPAPSAPLLSIPRRGSFAARLAGESRR